MSARTATKKNNEVKKEKKEFKLEQVLTLWINKGKKSGKVYLSGRFANGVKVIGLFNREKQNPKQPDISIYQKNESGELEKEAICSLWVNANDNSKKYASGKLGEQRLVGFFNSKATVDGKVPYLNVYFSDEEKEAEKPVEAKEPEFEEVAPDDDLPF